jgi:hypothetical protein
MNIGQTATPDTKFVSIEQLSQSILILFSTVPGERSNAFWAIGTQMVRNEGVSSLGHGFTASMMREFVYSGFRLGTYELFKDTYVLL